MTPLWMILVPTVPKRAAKFQALMTDLLGQCRPFDGEVRVMGWLNEGAPHLGAIRDAMVDEAAAMGSMYVSFVDDDDRPSADYVSEVMGVLAEMGSAAADHIGFKVLMTLDGQPHADIDHSLRHGKWARLPRDPGRPGVHQLVRDFTHIDPIRSELAQHGQFALARRYTMEDREWVRQVRPHVKTEAYIDRVLYHYDYRPAESAWDRPGAADGQGILPMYGIQDPNFLWHPESI